VLGVEIVRLVRLEGFLGGLEEEFSCYGLLVLAQALVDRAHVECGEALVALQGRFCVPQAALGLRFRPVGGRGRRLDPISHLEGVGRDRAADWQFGVCLEHALGRRRLHLSLRVERLSFTVRL